MRTVERPCAPSGVRAVAMMLGLVLVGALTVAAPPRPAHGVTRAPGLLAPAEGVLFGAHPSAPNQTDDAQRTSVVELESKLGRTLAIDHYYRPWNTLFPTFREEWDFDNGRIPMISWGKTYASDIIAGTHDELIRTRATAVATLGRPLFLRWFWEMDGNRNQQYAQSPAAYIAAWQHIRGIFLQQGATNAAFVWCPNASGFETGEAQEYYPGDEHVDWTCADGYNWYRRPGDNDQSFRSVFQAFHDWASTHPKPLMVGEYGVLEPSSPPDHKPNWVNASRAVLKTDLPHIAAVVYFNRAGNDSNGTFRDWRVNTSEASLQAFQLMGADPYFNGALAAPTPETNLGSGPQGTVNSTTAVFTFSSDQTGAVFQCRLDAGGFSACASPTTYTGLADRSHTFEVRASTAAGGTDPTSARRTWVVDTMGPAVTGVTPADGARGVGTGAVARVTFSEAVDPVTVTPSSFVLTGGGLVVDATASYDDATRNAFLSPTVLLQPGTAYSVTVKGGSGGVADPAGNLLAADRVWQFTTFAPVPDTAIDSGPPPTVASAAASLAFSSDQAGAEFQCRLDGTGFTACTSPTTYSGLADGPHAFEVRAWTPAGGTDPTPGQHTWSVDTTPPAVAGVTPADGATDVGDGSGLSVTFTEAVDPATVTPANLVLTVAGAMVDADVSYDDATRTASLSPTAPLQTGASYTATVKGGPGGVADPLGNPMAADREWRFTTATPPPPPEATLAFTPVADARVEEAHPNTNYGKAEKLRTDGGSDPDVESYLLFTVDGLTGPVKQAKLRLFVVEGTSDGPALYSSGTGWTESGSRSITWRTRPGRTSAAADDKGRMSSGRWVEYDVTSLVSGNGTFSFVLASRSRDAFAAYSRERSSKRPELVVTTG